MAGDTAGLDIDDASFSGPGKLDWAVAEEGCDIVVIGCCCCCSGEKGPAEEDWDIDAAVMSILVSFRKAVEGGTCAPPAVTSAVVVLLVKERVRGRKLRVRAKTLR